jgi:hypothetical protein
MSGARLSQSEYAQQRIVELFGELLIATEDAGLTHTSRIILRFDLGRSCITDARGSVLGQDEGKREF